MGLIMVIITFQAEREHELYEEMIRRATTLWLPSETNTHGRPPEEGTFYFRRDETETEPGGFLCIYRKEPGRWHIHNFLTLQGVPVTESIEKEMVFRFVREFFNLIAGPATEAVNGAAFIRFGVSGS